MTIEILAAALRNTTVNGTPLKFAHYAWDTAPAGDWGVYGEDGADQMQSDNRFAEAATIGTVDYYTKTDNGLAKAAIEQTFKTLQEQHAFAWYLNTITYEADTHFLHYEWEFSFA